MREGKLGLPGGLGRRDRVLPAAAGGSWGRNTDFCDDIGEARDVLEIPDEAERALAGGGNFCLQKVWEIPEKRVTKFGNSTLLFGAGVLK